MSYQFNEITEKNFVLGSINHFTIDYELSHLIQKNYILNWPSIPKSIAKPIDELQMLKELL